jgi:hypothetical protein
MNEKPEVAMKRKLLFSTCALLLTAGLLLSACQMAFPGLARRQSAETQSAAQQSAELAQRTASLQPTLTPLPRATRTPRPAPTATLDPALARAAQAEAAVEAYFAALEAQDFDSAAEQLSTYSLTVFSLTRGDAAARLHALRAKGAAWSGMEILGSEPFDKNTILVRVRYGYTQISPAATPTLSATAATIEAGETAEPVEEQWAVRLENGAWRPNWNNLIDYHTLETPAQTLNGITVKPIQANRFPDRIQLVLLMQNRTSQPFVFGQVNEILGTFSFAGQPFEAEKTQIILNPWRSVADAKLEVKGFFEEYPDSIEIRKWKNYDVKPWYVFTLN